MIKQTKQKRIEQIKEILDNCEVSYKPLPEWLDYINDYLSPQYKINNTKTLAYIFKILDLPNFNKDILEEELIDINPRSTTTYYGIEE